VFCAAPNTVTSHSGAAVAVVVDDSRAGFMLEPDVMPTERA